MNEQQSSNRLPLILSLIGAAILAVGGYFFFANSEPAVRGDKAVYAAQDAERAISAAGVSDKERAATEAIVRAYILENPEIITEAVEILQKREMAKRMGAAGPALAKAFPGAVAGNPNGSITIVEFTDYNCGFCRASVADVDRLAAGNKDIRIVYRELPILRRLYPLESREWQPVGVRAVEHLLKDTSLDLLPAHLAFRFAVAFDGYGVG